MVYSITYDLNKNGQNYDDLYKTLKSLGDWCHCLESTWFIDTSCSADEIKHLLLSVMDSNDLLFISEVSKYSAFVPQNAYTWLLQHVNHL